MNRCTNYYRWAILVVGVAVGFVCISRNSNAEKPHGGSNVKSINGELVRLGPEMPKTNIKVDYLSEMRGISTAPTSSRKKTSKHGTEKPWGNVRMRIVFDASKSQVDKEIDATRHHTGNEEALRIDPASHGIRSAVAIASHVSRVHGMYAHDSERTVALIGHDHHFVPHVLPVIVGQSLRIENRDGTKQIVRMHSSRGPEIKLPLAPGADVTWRFNHSEFLPVAATTALDPLMSAHIFVVDNPYIGVSDDHGTIVLTNVPAGEELEIRLWHERSGWLVLPDGAVGGHMHDGQLNIVVPPDGELELGEILIPPVNLASPNDHDRINHVVVN